jgi:hypothetical protein
MKTLKILIFALVITTAAMAFADLRNKKITGTSQGFALVELFTSEGCSSCPPADALIARVEKESFDKPVYILAFHVDYWNRGGWTDAFSSADYSARQKQYAQWLKLPSVYTPQAIVNGQTEFVGSEEGSLRNAIKAGLQKPVMNELVLEGINVNKDKASFHYLVKGNVSSSSLLIALVEKTATTKVERGENAGRTLSHVQIVRKLQSVPLQNRTSGSQSISLPNGLSWDNLEVIAFVQNTAGGGITGAARAALLARAAMVKSK